MNVLEPLFELSDNGSFAPDSLKQPIRDHLAQQHPNPLNLIRDVLNDNPRDPELLMMAAYAAVRENKADTALMYCKRYAKYYRPYYDSRVIEAIALAQKGSWYRAALVSIKNGIRYNELRYNTPGWLDEDWAWNWLVKVASKTRDSMLAQRKLNEKSSGSGKTAKPKGSMSDAALSRETEKQAPTPVLEESEKFPSLPALEAEIGVSISVPGVPELSFAYQTEGSADWLKARMNLARLSLFEGFGDLLCLPYLRDVDTYWYQVETARKVLRQFRGRVLLADEVGLGKTIEAGMVIKEYLLRGMAKRILILTPASVVGQWLQEMQTKFAIEFDSTYDALLRDDPEQFWSRPQVVASIATARRQENFEILSRQVYDLVVVDEAHHLKNRTTRNWKLVDVLKKRFLLLLSATPIQNSLVELYNLLTLLKPGIFNTEKEFRAAYMSAGKSRVPANRDAMRDLMRDVMIRNTRSQVDVRLPPRNAATLKLDPLPEEAECYRELSGLIQAESTNANSRTRLSLRHLLGTAGSSPAAAASAIKRFIKSGENRTNLLPLYERYDSIAGGCKESALLDILKRNPSEKTIVFVHYTDTLARLGRQLQDEGIEFESFHGSMSGPEKDSAIKRFREDVPVLLSTESGGEGRNLQFSNTLVNFDLPWNPMSIEQRIGRLHRIGQSRPIFIFNLAVKNTLEEYLLRVLDEKINMFELVVGEIGSILGEMDEDADFPEMVFTAWVQASADNRSEAFDQLGQRIAEAKRKYVEVKELDDQLFADDFIAG